MAKFDRVLAIQFGISVALPLSRAYAIPQSLCVNPGGTGGCQSTISGAVAMITKPVVTIAVAAGYYIDNVSINTGLTPKSLTLTITGVGAGTTAIDGNNAGSAFTIGSKAKVTLDGLLIEHGSGQPIPPAASIVGGGIFASNGTLTITNCSITNNRANFGVGIFASNQTMTITNSLISANTAFNLNASSGGGINFTVTKALKLTIMNSTIDSNSALDGAGLVLDNSKSSASRPIINISDSTISHNTATTEGAGVFVQDAKLTISDTTISGNIVTSGSGGGLLTSMAIVTLNNVTIADNSAPGLAGVGGGIYFDINNPSSLVFSNTIIASNSAKNSPDCNAFMRKPITSHDYNLIGDLSGCTILGKTTHNLTGDPKLGPLKNNGGTTKTQALLFGSPAAGTGNPATPNGLNSHCLANDQIGTARPKGHRDIGAYQIP
jgi:hypothetical protein